MKKLIAFLCAGVFLVPSAFAADGAAARRVNNNATQSKTINSPRNSDTTNRQTTTRAANEQTAATERAADTRHTVSRSATDVREGLQSRTSAQNVVSRALVSDDNTSATGRVASRVITADSQRNVAGSRTRIISPDTRTNPADKYISPTVASGTVSRAVSIRNSATEPVTAESIAAAKDRLEQTSELNKSCQEQYNDCMDQFCAVIDANQKRCSCSANLSRYTKVEDAVKDANTQLNDVAQRIRYVGLSADEIRAIMTATEAEEELTGKTDTTETRNMLEKIEEMIKDPASASTYSSDTYSGLDLDLDFDFSSDTDDIFSLDFLTNNSGSFSNLRGTQLYNAAKKRCNTILTQCKEVGATPQQITGNYDLAIDKDCIAYEQGLTKMNETLVSNVRSANRMLQKARLAVLQNKNQYDAKGCIGALDACMTDEMVCGEDYLKCLDPTKKYIDENGEVVLGQDVTNITAFMEKYDNSQIDSNFLKDAYGMKISETSCKTAVSDSVSVGNNGACVVKYLLQKIGTGQEVTDGGLCRAVLEKCQNYTYNDDKYVPYNDVVVNYVQRAMVNIKAGQQKAISDYASTCMLDIANCYNQQFTQVNSWSATANVDSIYRVMKGACRNVALTCAYAVFAEDGTSCPKSDGGTDTCLNSISEMFYQTLLCPDHSTYQTSGTGGDVNNKCKCNDGYEAWGSQCVLRCMTNATRNNNTGLCACNSGYTLDSSGTCVRQSQ